MRSSRRTTAVSLRFPDSDSPLSTFTARAKCYLSFYRTLCAVLSGSVRYTVGYNPCSASVHRPAPPFVENGGNDAFAVVLPRIDDRLCMGGFSDAKLVPWSITNVSHNFIWVENQPCVPESRHHRLGTMKRYQSHCVSSVRSF